MNPENRHARLLLWCFCLWGVGPIWGECKILTVPGEFTSIQSAIDEAVAGDEVVVSPGTYSENLQFKGKNLTLRSTNVLDTSIVNSTILDGGQKDSVVLFDGSESSTCALIGFTIQNGQANRGGGVQGNGTKATIRRNFITNNRAVPKLGAGIFLGGLGGGIADCDGLIEGNRIVENSAEGVAEGRGGGGGLAACNGVVENNTILRNTATEDGGGIFACNGTIQNNIVAGNRVVSDGGVSTTFGGGLQNCNGQILNNTIYGNHTSGSGGGLAFCQATIQNCILWANTADQSNAQLHRSSLPSYSCVQGGVSGGIGNLAQDPGLVSPQTDDFHLSSISPCLDAGGFLEGLTQDYEGDLRPINSVQDPRGDGSDYDIGADEFRGEIATPTSTFSLTPTLAPTMAPTTGPTPAPTMSPTVPPTASPTPVPTMSPTVPPTASPTPVPTMSPTASPTAAPTMSPTASPTAAPTLRLTTTITATPILSPTVTSTQIPTPSSTFPTPTSTSISTPTPSLTSTLTPTPSLTSTLTPTPSLTSTFAPTPSLTATLTLTSTPTPSPTPTATTPATPVQETPNGWIFF